MSFVCGVGALSAWRTRGSPLGLATGAAVSAAFGLGGGCRHRQSVRRLVAAAGSATWLPSPQASHGTR